MHLYLYLSIYLPLSICNIYIYIYIYIMSAAQLPFWQNIWNKPKKSSKIRQE